MKRALMLVLVLLLAACAPAMAAEQVRVGISCPYDDTGWAAAAAWRAETAAEDLGINYVLKPAATARDQVEDIDMFTRMDFDALILLPIDDSVEDVARKAMKTGLELLCFERSPGELVPDLCLSSDDARIGELGAAYIGEKLGGSGKVVLVTAPGASYAHRAASCRAALAENYPEIEVLGEYAADAVSREAGARVMEAILAEQPRVDGVYSCADALSIGMLEAAEAEDRLGDLKVMTGCGGSRECFECMDRYRDEVWFCTQTCSPYAIADLIEMCGALLDGEAVESAALPVETLDATNYAEWLDRCGMMDAPF